MPFHFSPSHFLNALLLSILLLGGFSAYHYGNFKGISQEELEANYLPKESIRFQDLPLDLQKRYIDKEAIIEQSKEANLLEDVYVDEEGKPIAEADVTPRDMKRMIQKLQKTLLFLQHDNLLITNEKNEWIKKLEELEADRLEERAQLQNQNLEKMNEAERQHYQNISDLTMKLNELQKENVLIAQRANLEANELRTTIDGLNTKAAEEAVKKTEDIKKARLEEQEKLTDYKEKIKLLNDQIALLNDQMSTQNETAKAAFLRKNEEINALKEEIALITKEKNDVMTRHSQEMIHQEQKHKQEIATYTKSIESLKHDTETLIAKHNEALSTQESEFLKRMAQKEETIAKLNTEIATAQKKIDALILENEKDFNKFRDYLENEKKINKELSVNAKKIEEDAQSKEKALNASLIKQNEELLKKESAIKGLENTIVELKNQKINIEAEVKRRVDENDRIHNKNYKAFNEKIASFEQAKQEMLLKLDKQINEYKLASEETYKKMQYHSNELTRSNQELKTKYDDREKEISELKRELSALQTQSDQKEGIYAFQLSELQASLERFQADAKQKEAEYRSKIQAFEAQIRAREIAMAGSKREDALSLETLKKELDSKNKELSTLNSEIKKREENLKTLQATFKQNQESASKSAQGEIDALKEKLSRLEKSKKEDALALRTLKEEYKQKELSYLEQIKEAQNALYSKDKSLANSKESLEKKLLVSEQTIKTLSEKLKHLENSAPKVSEKTTPVKNEKLRLIDSVTCADMGIGTNALSLTCKQNVKAFLAKYDSSYYYEVAPIVDNGGFASLKLIKSKKVGVEESEIDRISALANIGLGKARAKAGGDLVMQYIGEGAKISYALSNVEQDKARGFLIKVYR